MKEILARCIKTYPDEDDMVEYAEGNKGVDDVKIYYKDQEYYVTEDYYCKDHFEAIEPKKYKA